MKKFLILALAVTAIIAIVVLSRVSSNRYSTSDAPGNTSDTKQNEAPRARRIGVGSGAPEAYSAASGDKAVAVAKPASAPGTHRLGNELRAARAIPGDEGTSAVLQVKASMMGKRMEILEAMRNEDDPATVMMLAMILAENSHAMEDPRVIASLRDLLRHSSPEKRQAALAALSFARDLSPELIAEVTAMSREDSSMEARISAIAAMSIWMEKQPQFIEQLSRELLVTSRVNDHVAVRGNAIQLIANQMVKLPDDVVSGMIQHLASESVPENRQLASLGVGGATGTMQPQALAALEQAYLKETHDDTKRVILMQIVRASGDGAVGVLGRLPAGEELLQNDINDYRSIIAKGITNPDEIWTQKSLLDAERGTEVGMNHEEHHKH